MSMKKTSVEHQPSILLSQEANTKIFSLLEPKSQALSTALVGVVISKPPQYPDWRPLRTGVATLTKDYTRKSYFVQIYDIVDWERLREEELSKGTAYHASMPKFHQFAAGKGQTMGLKFASEAEARKFAEIARAIVMTGTYKTEGCPPSPVVEPGKDHTDQNEVSSDEGEIKLKDQPISSENISSLLQPPPPTKKENEHLQLLSPLAPSSQVNKGISLSQPQSSMCKPKRPLSSPPMSPASPHTITTENTMNEKGPKSKRFTKEMIGKPTDFKHIYHVGYNTEAPIDEKALRAAVGSRPPAPTRPPPPPPPGKRSGINRAEKDKASSVPANNKEHEIGLSSLPGPNNSRNSEEPVGPEHPNSPTISNAELEDPDSSFATELIEEYLKRSNLTSDILVQEDTTSEEALTTDNDVPDMFQEPNDKLLEQDMTPSEANTVKQEEDKSDTQMKICSASMKDTSEISATEEPPEKSHELDNTPDSSQDSSEHHTEPQILDTFCVREGQENEPEASLNQTHIDDAGEDDEVTEFDPIRESTSSETSCSTVEQQSIADTTILDQVSNTENCTGGSAAEESVKSEPFSPYISTSDKEQASKTETTPLHLINNSDVVIDLKTPIAPVRHKKKTVKASCMQPPPTPSSTLTQPSSFEKE